MIRLLNPRVKDPAIVAGIQVNKFYLDGEHPFKSYANNIFQVCTKILSIYKFGKTLQLG